MRNRLLFSLLIALGTVSPVWAEQIPIQDPVNWPKGSTPTTLRLRGVAVKDALQTIADQQGVNVVFDPSVSGTIYLDFKDTRLDQVVETILRTNGLSMQPIGNSFFIYRSGMYGDMVVKAFPLNRANAQQVAMQINQILGSLATNVGAATTGGSSAGGSSAGASTGTSGGTQGGQSAVTASPTATTLRASVLAEPRTNSLLVKAPPPQASLIEQLIKQLDVVLPTQVYRLKYLPAGDAAMVLRSSVFPNAVIGSSAGGAAAAGAAAAGGASGGSAAGAGVTDATPKLIPLSRDNFSLLVIGTSDQQALIGQMIPQIDRKLAQVLVKTRIIEANTRDLMSAGFSITGSAGGLTATVGGGPNTFKYSTSAVSAASIGVDLDALVTNNKAKVLASPTVLAMDNQKSVIKITDEIIDTIQVQTQTNANVTQTFEIPSKTTTGVTLEITPRINDDGEIMLNVHPVVSFPRERVQSEGRLVATLKATREYQSQEIRVRSGQTIEIGGLIQDQTSVSDEKIPILGDIPFLGALFRRSSVITESSEVRIYITPELVKETPATQAKQ